MELGALCVPTISSFYGIIIRMFFNDHAPPHFHAQYGSHQAEMDIRTLQVLAGYLPPRALALASEWGRAHQAELLSNWELCRLHQFPKPVAPLE